MSKRFSTSLRCSSKESGCSSKESGCSSKESGWATIRTEIELGECTYLSKPVRFTLVEQIVYDGIVVVMPLLTCNTRPSVTDSLLCEGYIVTFGLAEDILPELSNSFGFIELAVFTSFTHLSWSHVVVFLNECTPFLRETDIHVRFVRLTVGNPHNGNAVVKGDV